MHNKPINPFKRMPSFRIFLKYGKKKSIYNMNMYTLLVDDILIAGLGLSPQKVTCLERGRRHNFTNTYCNDK